MTASKMSNRKKKSKKERWTELLEKNASEKLGEFKRPHLRETTEDVSCPVYKQLACKVEDLQTRLLREQTDHEGTTELLRHLQQEHCKFKDKYETLSYQQETQLAELHRRYAKERHDLQSDYEHQIKTLKQENGVKIQEMKFKTEGDKRLLQKNLAVKNGEIQKLEFVIENMQNTMYQLERKRCSECDIMRRQMAKCIDHFVMGQKALQRRFRELQVSLEVLYNSLHTDPDINYRNLLQPDDQLYQWIYGKHNDWMTLQRQNVLPVLNHMDFLYSEITKPLDVQSITERLLEGEKWGKEKLFVETEHLQDRLEQSMAEVERERERNVAIKKEQKKIEEKCQSLETSLSEMDQELLQRNKAIEMERKQNAQIEEKCQSLKISLSQRERELAVCETDLLQKCTEYNLVVANKEELMTYTEGICLAFVKVKDQLKQIYHSIFEKEMESDELWKESDFSLLHFKMSESRSKDNKHELDLELQKQSFVKHMQSVEANLNQELKVAVLQKNEALTRCAVLKTKIEEVIKERHSMALERNNMIEKKTEIERKLNDLSSKATDLRRAYSELEDMNTTLRYQLQEKTTEANQLHEGYGESEKTMQTKIQHLTTSISTCELHMKNKQGELEELKWQLEELKSRYDDVTNKLQSKIQQLEDVETNHQVKLQNAVKGFSQLQQERNKLEKLKTRQEEREQKLVDQKRLFVQEKSKASSERQRRHSSSGQLQGRLDEVTESLTKDEKENKQLKASNKQLLTETKEQETELASLKSKLSELDHKRQYANQQLKSMETDHKNAMESYRVKIESKEEEVQQLRGDMETRHQKDDSQGILLKRLQDELSGLTQDNTELASQLQQSNKQAESLRIENSEIRKSLEEKESAVLELKNRLSVKEDAHQRDLSKQNSMLVKAQSDLADKKQQVREMEVDYEESRQKIEDQKKNMQKRLMSEVENKDQTIEHLTRKRDDLEDQVDGQKVALEKAESEITRLRSEVKRLRSELSKVKSQQKERLMSDSEKVQTLMRENEQLSERNRKLDELLVQTNEELKNTEKTCQSLKRKTDRLQSDNDKLQRDLKQQSEKISDQMMSDLENKDQTIQHLTKERHDLEGQVKDQKVMLEKEESELSKLRSELSKMKTQHKESQMSDSEKVQTLTRENDGLSDRNRKLDKLLVETKEDLMNRAKTCQSLERKADRLQSDNDKLGRDLKQQTERNEEMSDQNAQLSEQLSQSEKELSSLEKEFKGLERKHQNLQSAHDELRLQLQQHGESSQAVSLRVAATEQLLSQTRAELTTSRESLQHKVKEYQKLQQEFNRFRHKLVQTEKENAKNIESHTKEIEEKDQLVEQVEDEKHLLEDEIATLKKTLRKSEDKCSKLTNEMTQLKSKVAEKEKIHKRDQTKAQERLAILQTFEHEKEELEAALEKQHTENQELQSRVKEQKKALGQIKQRAATETQDKDAGIRQLEKEKVDLQVDLQRQVTAVSEARRKYAQLETELEQVEKGEKKLAFENNKLQKTVQEKLDAIEQLNKRVEQLTREAEKNTKDFEAERVYLNGEIAKYKTDNKNLKADMKQMKADWNCLLSENQELEKMLKDKEAAIAKQGRRHTKEVEKKENEREHIMKEIQELNATKENQIRQLENEKEHMEMEIHELGKHVKDIKLKNADLSAENSSMQFLLKDREGELTRLSTKLDQLKVKLTDAKKKLTTCEKELDATGQQNQQLCQQNEQLESERDSMAHIIKQKDASIKDLSQRLSMEMGNKVSADESCLENISIKNRPMNIATDYDLLCSNEWLAAKTALDESSHAFTEKDKAAILCDVLILSLQEGNKLRTTLLQSLSAQSLRPGIQVDPDSAGPRRTFREQLVNNLMDFLRETADEADLSRLSKAVEDHVSKKHKAIRSDLSHKDVGTYCKAAALVTWKMVLQRPPMTLVQSGLGKSWQGEKKQDLFWSSSDPNDPQSKVEYYIHPALYHGEALMVKGRVLLSKK